jgi:transposase
MHQSLPNSSRTTKDFRRIATRYDKLARNFLAAVHLAALVAYWLN